MADVDTMTSIVPHALIMATRPTMVPVKNATNQYGHKAVLEKNLEFEFHFNLHLDFVKETPLNNYGKR